MGWAPHRKQPKTQNIYVQKTCQNKQKNFKKYKKIEKRRTETTGDNANEQSIVTMPTNIPM